MSSNYNNIQWVIQRNLTNTDDLKTLVQGCEKIGVPYIEIDIIPFSDQLPDFDQNKLSIYYGSTTMGQLVYRDRFMNPGFFFNHESFSIENYFAKWGSHMLNYGALVTSFGELMLQPYEDDKLLFIRPDDDSKSFSGEVKKFSEIKSWYDRLKMFDNTSLSLDSKIVVSEPYHLNYEWRLWIVDKQVVTASKYREDFKLKKERGCPPEVIQFAEQRCLEYTPHNVFVMDICQTGDSYYIVECGCLNSAGFYHADIEAIVKSVTEYFSKVINAFTKDKTILDLIEKLKLETDFDRVEIVDHWDGLLCSVGIKRGVRMVYIDSLNFRDGRIDGYDYDLEILNEEQPDHLNVIKEGLNVTEQELIAVIKQFLEI